MRKFIFSLLLGLSATLPLRSEARGWFFVKNGIFDVGSVALDGINDHVLWSTQLENYQITNAFTLAFRFKITSNTTSYFYSRQDGTPKGIAVYYVADGTGGHLGCQLLQNGPNNLRSDTAADTVSLNVWHTAIIVNDGLNASTSITIYIDNATPSQTQLKVGAPTDIQSTVSSYLGLRNSGTFPFPGKFNNFGMYSEAADGTERTNWHNSSTALANPKSDIGSGIHFFDFNTGATDSIGTNHGSLENGATIGSDVG